MSTLWFRKSQVTALVDPSQFDGSVLQDWLLGIMINRYYIIDDFYGNPDKLVEVALASAQEVSAKKDSASGNYAGVMTSTSYFANQFVEPLKALLLEPTIVPATDANGRIRFSKENDTFKQYIHFDAASVKTKWAGVVYLSKQHPSIEGTAFWKHKRTGLEAMPRTLEGLSEYGWKSGQDLEQFLETEGMDEALWEKTLSVPYKYNRLVLFRPWMFHSPGKAFGNSLEESRAVQTLFLGN